MCAPTRQSKTSRKELLARAAEDPPVMGHHPTLPKTEAIAASWDKITDKINARRK